MRQFNEKDAILNLQTYLRALHLSDPTYPAVTVDGVFDTQTKNALSEFQRRNDLPPTGTADSETWKELYEEYLDILEDAELPGPIIPFPSYPSSYTIKLGERSFLVAIVQYLLNEIGTVYNTFTPIDIDGNFGSATENAVKLFQRTHALSETGEVDRRTWNTLSDIYNLSMHYIEQN